MRAAAKPTPGPWEVEIFGDGSFTEVRVTSRYGIIATPAETGFDPKKIEPNARLIAAAPDLLEALIAASHALKSYRYGNTSTDLAREVAEECDVAIAKATGAQS